MRILQYSDVEGAYDDPIRIGKLVETIRTRRGDDTVVVGTGDNIAPSVLALVTNGRQSIDFFTAVDPDIETFGNHDFDFGPDVAIDIVEASPQEWVSANVRDESGPLANVSPFAVVERDGESAGFVGVTEQESAIPDELTVVDPVESTRKAIDDLQDLGVDWVVVLAHLNDDTVRRVARTTDADVILAGHVHSTCKERFGNTVLVRPDAGGFHVWEVILDAQPDARCHEVSRATSDEGVVAALASRRSEAKLDDVVTTLESPVARDRDSCFDGDSDVAAFVADAYRWAAGADIGLVDTRAIRNGQPLVDEVTVADIIGIVPFDTLLHVVSVNGEELERLVADIVLTECQFDRRDDRLTWWGYCSGMEFVWDPVEQRVVDVTVGGDPIDPEKAYTLATNGFVVNSDCEFAALTPTHTIRTDGIQYQALVEYARADGFRAASTDRMVYRDCSSKSTGTDSR